MVSLAAAQQDLILDIVKNVAQFDISRTCGNQMMKPEVFLNVSDLIMTIHKILRPLHALMQMFGQLGRQRRRSNGEHLEDLPQVIEILHFLN